MKAAFVTLSFAALAAAHKQISDLMPDTQTLESF